jgi:hypothetical protein
LPIASLYFSSAANVFLGLTAGIASGVAGFGGASSSLSELTGLGGNDAAILPSGNLILPPRLFVLLEGGICNYFVK